MSTLSHSKVIRQLFEDRDRRTTIGILLILPAIFIILLVLVYPFLNAVIISFMNRVTGAFVGISHYEWLFTSGRFWPTLRRSLVWTVGNMVLQGIAGVGIALLLHRRFFGRSMIRTVMLVPFVIPTAVTAVIWEWMLNTTYGPLNQWLIDFGLITQPVNPLTNPSLALFGAIFINSWRWTPLVALVVFAVLQTIPTEEYEAARIEGAGLLNEFYHVTYPHLKSSMTVLGLLGFLLTFNIFDMIWLLTGGGPVDSTTTLPVYIYEIAFELQSFGRAAATSVVLFIVLAVFVVLYFQQEEFQEGGEFA